MLTFLRTVATKNAESTYECLVHLYVQMSDSEDNVESFFIDSKMGTSQY